MIGHEIPPYTNPADQLIKLMHAKEKPEPEDIKEQEELFANYNRHLRSAIEDEMKEAESRSQPLNKEQLTKFRASSFATQFHNLMVRASKNLVRNITISRVRIAQVVFLGIFMDILFWNKDGYDLENVESKNGAFFFICMSQLMLSLQSVILTCKPVFNGSSAGARAVSERTGKQNVWSLPLLLDEEHH